MTGPGTGDPSQQPAGLPGFFPPAQELPRTDSVRRIFLRPAAPCCRPQALSTAPYAGGLDNPYLAEVAQTTDARTLQYNALLYADTEKPPASARAFIQTIWFRYLLTAQALHGDGLERAAGIWVASEKAFRQAKFTGPIRNQAASLPRAFVGQFSSCPLIRSSSSGAADSGGGWLLKLARAGQFRANSLGMEPFPRRTVLEVGPRAPKGPSCQFSIRQPNGRRMCAIGSITAGVPTGRREEAVSSGCTWRVTGPGRRGGAGGQADPGHD